MAADSATPTLTAQQQQARSKLAAASATPPPGNPQSPPPAQAEASPDTSASGFIEKSDAELAGMSKEDQDQYYAAYNKSQAAPTTAAPAPSDADQRAGTLTQAQIDALPYQQQQQYLRRHPPGGGGQDSTFGSSTYVPPPPGKASDYVSDEHFIPQVGDVDASGNPVIDPATGKQKTHDATEADTVAPVDWTVTDDQTVQGQMKKLTTDLQTNPVYQSLAEEMKRVNAAQGGGNSLMAESAAYDKVIGLAFNIATNDAATYAKSAEFNATMANQFGLAKNNFIYQALLSDQNYSQSQVLQSNQIKGNLDSIDRQISGQLESTRIAGKAQIRSAEASASGQIASASIYADASTKNAELSAKTSLTEAEMSRQTTLDSLQIDYQSKSALLSQGGQIDIAKIGATGAMEKDVNAANAADTFAKQATLQYQSQYAQFLLQTNANLANISMTPGLTAEQQANAVKTAASQTRTDLDLLGGFYASFSHSSGSSSGTAPNYADYLSYPGFGGPAQLPFYQGHKAGDTYPTASAATGSDNKPFIPSLSVG